MMRPRFLGLLILLLPVAAAAAPEGSTCVSCHFALDDRNAGPARLWKQDIHRKAGIGCHDCHGGNPLIVPKSMHPTEGFVGRPGPGRSVALCGNCHADPDRTPDPAQATDQLLKYRTGSHGNSPGGTAPTCVTCHGSHGMRRTEDPSSPVFVLSIPELCIKCHDTGDSGDVDGPRRYFGDVHGRALILEGDPQAPVCTDCHGAHRARVPDASGILSVCGKCHIMERDQFQSGPHGESFLLAGQPTCVHCHGGHGIEASGLEEITGWVTDTCQECHGIGESAMEMGREMDEKLGLAMSLLYWLRDSSESFRAAGLDTSEMERLNEEAYGWLLQVESAIHSVTGNWEELTGMAKVKMMASWELARDNSIEIGIRRIVFLFFALLAVSILALLAYKLKLLERDRQRRHLLGSPEARQREQEQLRK